MSKFVETTTWTICDVCDEYEIEGSTNTVGWLQVETMALGIFVDTRKTRHLCIVCREEFDNFWGK